MYTFFGIVSAYLNKLFIFWRKNVRLNPNLTIMDFKGAEEIVKQKFLQCLEKEGSVWGEGEAADINGFFLRFYKLPIKTRIRKWEFSNRNQ